MSTYELTFLLNEETELNALRQLFKAIGAKIISEEKWGKKTLAYPIKKNQAADFYQWIFEIETDKVNTLRQKLTFNEKLIRFLLLQKKCQKSKLKA